jgi:hypothetical protein
MSEILREYLPGVSLTRPDGARAVVVAVDGQAAEIRITHHGGQELAEPETWQGDPADLANCWNLAE